MKIVIDNSIPFIQGVFEPFSEVVYKDGWSISNSDLRDAGVLITRSRTRCDKALLEGTEVRMIATATIGTEHIDLDYCEKNGIFISASTGSNAGAVMNYVFSALYGAASRKGISLYDSCIGIIGAGNVGNKVDATARILGFRTMLYDPVRAEREGGAQFSSLDELLFTSDVITLHAPLTDSTRGMVESEFLSKMKIGSIFINTANGRLVNEKDLIDASGKLGAIIIDTWLNEPDINRDLLSVADIATPHIAAYSYKGKQLSTMMAVRSAARFMGISELYDFFPKTDNNELESVKVDLRGKDQGQIASIIQYNYPVFTDDFMFRIDPGRFKELRDNYRYRREFYTD